LDGNTAQTNHRTRTASQQASPGESAHRAGSRSHQPDRAGRGQSPPHPRDACSPEHPLTGEYLSPGTRGSGNLRAVCGVEDAVKASRGPAGDGDVPAQPRAGPDSGHWRRPLCTWMRGSSGPYMTLGVARTGGPLAKSVCNKCAHRFGSDLLHFERHFCI
jgi:hypothetical protein